LQKITQSLRLDFHSGGKAEGLAAKGTRGIATAQDAARINAEESAIRTAGVADTNSK
jgi:hypothetical protein